MAKAETPEYGIAELAKEAGKDQAEVRAVLRQLGTEKTDGRYRWTKKGDFDRVVKEVKAKLGEVKPRGRPPSKAKAEEAKPAKTVKRVKKTDQAPAAAAA